MKNPILLLCSMLLIVSCVSNNNKVETKIDTTRTIVDPQNRQDTVYFNYVLGQKTKNITDALIKEGKFTSKTPVRKGYTMSMGGFSQKINTTGYPFDLYVGENKYSAQLVLFDVNGDRIDKDGILANQHIYIEGTNKYPIISALKQQYGEPNTPPADGYKVEVPQELEVFWNISNKAVYLETFSSFMILVYEDIIAVQNKNNQELAAKRAAEEAVRQHNLEQSKKTQF